MIRRGRSFFKCMVMTLFFLSHIKYSFLWKYIVQGYISNVFIADFSASQAP